MRNVDVRLFGIWDEAIFSRICFIIAGLVKTNQEATIIERRKNWMKKYFIDNKCRESEYCTLINEPLAEGQDKKLTNFMIAPY